jgi:hypothetical protein
MPEGRPVSISALPLVMFFWSTTAPDTLVIITSSSSNGSDTLMITASAAGLGYNSNGSIFYSWVALMVSGESFCP